MCTVHPFPSEELLEHIPSADCVISGLGHDTNHLKGGKVLKKMVDCDFFVPLENRCPTVPVSNPVECWADRRLLLHL